MPAHCQNLNILNRRKTIQQLKTISDNVLTAYIFTIKRNSIDSFQYTRHWQPVQSLQMRSWFMCTDLLPRHLPTGFELYIGSNVISQSALIISQIIPSER